MQQQFNNVKHARRFTAARLALALLLLGLLWRTVRYLLQFPIWGDEALLAVNFAWLDYGQLAHRLENCQVAPLLFLWGERAAWRWLGPGMLSMRLLPFLAGMGSLLLYWKLAALMLGPRARLFAIGFLAVAIWPVSMSTLLKPYSFDLFMALALLLPAVKWLKNPVQTFWLALLAVLAPFALLASYPAVFVAGAASMAMLVPAWKQGWKTRCWFTVYNITLLAGFIFALRIGAAQLGTLTGSGTTTQVAMDSYWADGFPPSSPLVFARWLVLTLTGQMSAYAFGSSNGGSSLTVVACLIGIWRWIRRKRWEWLVLLTGPVFLNLLAAAIHRYPFGASCRLSQHLAPSICILAGLGLAVFVQKVLSHFADPKKWTLFIAALFGLVGSGGLAWDILHPYRDQGCLWMQTTMRSMLEDVPPEEPLVVCASPQKMEIVFTWYWTNGKKNTTWNYELPATHPDDKLLCGFCEGDAAMADTACKQLSDELLSRDPAWHLVKRVPREYTSGLPDSVPQRCELFFFARSP